MFPYLIFLARVYGRMGKQNENKKEVQNRCQNMGGGLQVIVAVKSDGRGSRMENRK